MPANKPTSYTWYRGESTNFLPGKDALLSPDGIADFVVRGWEPAEPFIDRSTNFTAFGSCFAAHISEWLAKRNYNILTKQESGKAYVIRCGEGLVNTFAILGQFEWAFENRVPEGEFWHGYDAEAFGYDDTIRRETRDIFLSTDLFILTFGLSEVWYDKPTGEVFWRAVPMDKFDPGRHGFRLTTPEENAANIERIYGLIRRHVPKAKAILTLSPVPLIATFRSMPCISASTVSKATLRIAIDQVIGAHRNDGVLHYWPSYEIVMEAFADNWEADRLHVKWPILDYVMTLFEAIWCRQGPSRKQLIDALILARRSEGAIPQQFFDYVDTGSLDMAKSVIAKWREADTGLIGIAALADEWLALRD